MDQNFIVQVQELTSRFNKLVNIDDTWKMYGNKDGYMVHTKMDLPTELQICRIQTIMDAPCEQVLDALTNSEKRKEYDKGLESSTLVERLSEEVGVVHIKLKQFAIFFQPRDMVMMISVKRNEEDGSILKVGTSVPYSKVKGYERATMHFYAWHITPFDEVKSKVIVLTHMDLGGNIPKAITNKGTSENVEMVKQVHKYLRSKK